MIKEISKKTFILSIAKLVLSILFILLLCIWKLPGEINIITINYIFQFISALGNIGSGIDAVIIIFGGIGGLLFIIFAVVYLIKNILYFIDILNIKRGKKEFDKKILKKKTKRIKLIAPAFFYFIFNIVFENFEIINPYLGFIFMIIDIVLVIIMNKSILESTSTEA